MSVFDEMGILQPKKKVTGVRSELSPGENNRPRRPLARFEGPLVMRRYEIIGRIYGVKLARFWKVPQGVSYCHWEIGSQFDDGPIFVT
jgi:hypothetical protein